MFPSSLDGLVIMRLSEVAFTRLREPFPNYETKNCQYKKRGAEHKVAKQKAEIKQFSLKKGNKRLKTTRKRSIGHTTEFEDETQD